MNAQTLHSTAPGRRSSWRSAPIPELTTRAWLGALLCTALAFTAPRVVADTVLTGALSHAVCGISDAGGIRPVECLSFAEFSQHGVGFSADLRAGETGFVSVTLHYEYRDQGLALADPGVFYTDPEGFQWVTTDHEAGAIYPFSNLCEHARYCPREPGLFVMGSGYPPLLLGLNTEPDDLRGTIELYSSVSIGPDYAFGVRPTDIVAGWRGETYSAPIPEPATFLLMAAGLALVSLARRHGARPGVPPSSRPSV